MVGLETAFGVCYTKLCREQRIPLEMLRLPDERRSTAVLGLADHKGLLDRATTPMSCWWISTICMKSTPTSCTARARTALMTVRCSTARS